MIQIPEDSEADFEIPDLPLAVRVGWGLAAGAGAGVLLLLVGVARGALVLVLGVHIATPGSRDLDLALGYVAAFAAAGGVTAALWPLRKTLIGAYVVGYMGAGIVCAAIGFMFGRGDSVTSNAVGVALMTLVFGSAAGSGIRSSEEDAAIQRRIIMRRLRAKAKSGNRPK